MAGFRVMSGALASYLLLLVGTAAASSCYMNFNTADYPSCKQLSPNVSLHWSVHAGAITFALDVDGDWNWVGVGLSESGMLGADIAVASQDSNSASWTVVDYWSEAFAYPTRDNGTQDAVLVSAARGQGSTRVAVRRPLVSCDATDRAVINDTRQTVIYAYGSGPLAYHGPVNRGMSEIVLVPDTTSTGNAVLLDTPPLQTFDIAMPNLTVPSAITSYYCVNVKLPSDAKYHIYYYEPILDNVPLLHHFVGYWCRSAPNTPVGQPYDCLADAAMECDDFYLGWAPGMERYNSPENAALSFGGNTDVQYISLQIHYNNLQGLSNQVDSSGFRLHYSSTLKQYDMGMLTLGTKTFAIPPGVPSYTTVPNVCPGACFSKLGPITLFDSTYHMHQLGRKMITRHVRNGTELAPLGQRDYFDFNYQNQVNVPPESRTVLPGDSLITTCTFTGEGRTNVTRYGQSTYEEMCFNFLSYYPYNPNITYCMGIDTIGMAGCTVKDNLDTLTSPTAVVAAVQAGYLLPLPSTSLNYTPYAPTCARSATVDEMLATTAPTATPAPKPTPAPQVKSGGAEQFRCSLLAVLAIASAACVFQRLAI